MSHVQTWMLLISAVLLAGCGSTAPPTERLVSTESAIRGAQELGAKDVPRASLYLKLAQEQLEEAKALIQDKEHKRADLVLQRAQIDAELSVALARESTTRNEAQQALEQVHKLKDRSKP